MSKSYSRKILRIACVNLCVCCIVSMLNDILLMNPLLYMPLLKNMEQLHLQSSIVSKALDELLKRDAVDIILLDFQMTVRPPCCSVEAWLWCRGPGRDTEIGV